MYNNFRGGFGGGNMQNLLKQAQKMQEEMEQKQRELEESEFTSSVGGGMVEVTMNGKYNVLKVNIKREVVDPEDVEMLSDLITSAINSCVEKIDTAKKDNMPSLPAGMGF